VYPQAFRLSAERIVTRTYSGPVWHLREQPGDGLKIQPNGPRFNFVN